MTVSEVASHALTRRRRITAESPKFSVTKAIIFPLDENEHGLLWQRSHNHPKNPVLGGRAFSFNAGTHTNPNWHILQGYDSHNSSGRVDLISRQANGRFSINAFIIHPFHWFIEQLRQIDGIGKIHDYHNVLSTRAKKSLENLKTRQEQNVHKKIVPIIRGLLESAGEPLWNREKHPTFMNTQYIDNFGLQDSNTIRLILDPKDADRSSKLVLPAFDTTRRLYNWQLERLPGLLSDGGG